MNKARMLIAGTVAAGIISIGAVGVASADSSTTTAPTPSTAAPTGNSKACTNATQRLTKLDGRETKVQARITKLQAAEAAATKAGQTTKADRIQVRISKANVAEQVITTRMSRIEKRCNVAAPAPAPAS